MDNVFDVRVLGPFEVTADGVAVNVGGRKRGELVALLALQAGRVVAVERLAEGLWGSRRPTNARNAVQHHVTRLRRDLGPTTIASAPDGYALRGAAVDALLFTRRLEQARVALRAGDARGAAAAADDALQLWRGPALLGFLDSEWASAEAARLEALRVDALEARFEAALALGDHATVLPEIRGAVTEHPFRERLWGQLMLALYRGGRQADALDAFQDARRMLSEQLGLEPGPELRRVQAAILVHDTVVDGTPGVRRQPGNLPAPVTSFVGRHELLVTVRRLLLDRRLVTLLGPPGAGKSRVALELARSSEPDFPDGAWLVDLAHAGRTGDVGRAVASAVGAQ